MNKEPFKKPTLEETLKHLDALRDEDIDISDSPEWTPEMWARAKFRDPRPKEQIAIRLDADLLAWFKAQGAGYQTRINAVLRIYMDAEKNTDAA